MLPKSLPIHMFWATDILNKNAIGNSPLDARDNTPALPASQEADEATALLPTILPLRATSSNDCAAACHAVERDDRSSCQSRELRYTRSQKHWHVILLRLVNHNTMPQTTWHQRARCASLKSRPGLDYEIHFTTLIERCAHTLAAILH